MAGGDPDTTGSVNSVDTALRLLLLYREHEALGITQTAELLGVGRSTAHRMMTTLRRHDFVVQDLVTRAYRAGPALRELGAMVAGAVDLRARCRPYLEALCQEVGETIQLMVLRGSDVLFIDSVETGRALRVGSREGVAMPAHVVSGGKAMLASLSPERLHELYPDSRLLNVTRRSLRSRAALERELDRVRLCGYGVSVEEGESEITAAGAAVPGLPGGERLAVAISAPSSRVRDEDDLRAAGEAARRCAGDLAQALGTTPP